MKATVAVAALAVSVARGEATNVYASSCAEDEANCCFAADRWPKADGARFRCEKDPSGAFPCAVKLGINSWAGSFINVHLASIFIEEFLGYPVELRANYSDFSGTTAETDQFAELASGVIDAILEVWPSGHKDNFQKYVLEDASVVDAGALGAVGTIGWYTPTFALEENDMSLEYWRTLLQPDKVALFRNPAGEATCCQADVYAGSDFPCMPTAALGGTTVADGGLADASECDADPTKKVPTYGGRFVAGASDWVQFDNQLIRNLGLNLTIEYASSEANLVAAIESSIATLDPVLLYFWQPHAMFKIHNLTRVLLPPSTAECHAKAADGGVDCDYPTDIFCKVLSRAMATDKPDVAVLLSAFRYDGTGQQEEMLANLYTNPSKSVRGVACDWAKANEATWAAWTRAVDVQFSNRRWRQEELKPVYTGCACDEETGVRQVVRTISQSAYAAEGLVDVSPSGDACAAGSGSTYTSRWSVEDLPRAVVRELPCPYVSASSGAAAVVSALVWLSIAVLAALAAGILVLRKAMAVRAGHVGTMLLFLLGATLLNLGRFLALGAPDSSQHCMLTVLCGIAGFTFFVGALLVKQYVIVTIVRVKYKKSANRKVGVLGFGGIILALCSAAIFALWAALVGFTPEQTLVLEQYAVYETTCPFRVDVFMCIVFVGFIALIASCVLALQTRNFDGLIFGEAKFMYFANYQVAICAVISVAIGFMSGVDAGDRATFLAASTCVGTLVPAVLIAGTRVYAGWIGATNLLVFSGSLGDPSAPTKVASNMQIASVVPV
jgi:glycine betaine/proline transport system substrate-binding protein